MVLLLEIVIVDFGIIYRYNIIMSFELWGVGCELSVVGCEWEL